MSSCDSGYELIIVTYYHFPCHHPVLENVFAKHLGKKKKILWLMKGDKKLGCTQDWHNSRVHLIGIDQNKPNNLLAKLKIKLKDITLFLALIRLIKINHPKTILIRDMPVLVFGVSMVRFFLNVNIYYQFSAPQGDISIGFFKKDKKFSRLNYLFKGLLFKIMNKFALTFADMIISISEFHKNEIKKKYPRKRVIPLTMGVDEDWVSNEICNNDKLKELKSNDYWITYFGSLNNVRNPMFLLQLYRLVHDKIPNSRLVLIGKYSIKEWNHYFNNAAIKPIKNRITLIGHVDREKLRQYLLYSDVTLSPIPPTKYYIISSPTKVYESLGMRVPVIANSEIYEQQIVLQDSSGGIAVPYTIDDFANATINLLNSDQFRVKCGELGKEYILNNYTYKTLAERISYLFEDHCIHKSHVVC